MTDSKPMDKDCLAATRLLSERVGEPGEWWQTVRSDGRVDVCIFLDGHQLETIATLEPLYEWRAEMLAFGPSNLRMLLGDRDFQALRAEQAEELYASALSDHGREIQEKGLAIARAELAEYERDFLARLTGSAIARATVIAPGEKVIEHDETIAGHALTGAVERLRERADQAEDLAHDHAVTADGYREDLGRALHRAEQAERERDAARAEASSSKLRERADIIEWLMHPPGRVHDRIQALLSDPLFAEFLGSVRRGRHEGWSGGDVQRMRGADLGESLSEIMRIVQPLALAIELDYPGPSEADVLEQVQRVVAIGQRIGVCRSGLAESEQEAKPK